MYTPDALLDVHARTRACFAKLLEHCRQLTPEELDRDLEGFGYGSVRLQLHHAIGAEKYWLGVLEGRIDIDEDAHLYPDVASLEAYAREVGDATEAYLRAATAESLSEPRSLRDWRGNEVAYAPARVILRTRTHAFHHIGQVLAMCRLMGKPGGMMDFPLD